MSEVAGEVESRGWDAIDAALAPIYGKQESLHYAPVLPYILGGKEPLNGISVYQADSPTHFHFVTYGFSELYEKESEDPEVSGFGFELTFRLARDPSDREPPGWSLNFLQNVAKYVFATGNAFDERHHMTLNGPIALGSPTDVTAIVLILDPQLGAIDTPNGRLKFLQVVGLCGDEYELLKQGYFAPIVDRVLQLAPLAVTDIFRASILSDPDVVAEIRANPPKTNQRELFGTIVEWKEAKGEVHFKIGATLIKDICQLIPPAHAENEPLLVFGKKSAIVFGPGDENYWNVDEGVLTLSLTSETTQEIIGTLQPVRGCYRWKQFPGLEIEVVPVEIKDGDGKVVEVVG